MTFTIEGLTDGREFREAIDDLRFQEIHCAKQTYVFALELAEKINLLIDNYYELEVELLKLAEGHRIWPRREHIHAMQERLLLDRRIVNLLTACRLYLDHSLHTASSLFGEPDPAYTSAKARAHTLYDESFGFRFMEELRNHVQHRGLLVDSIVYWYGHVVQDNQDCVQYTVEPRLELSSLEEDTKFKRTILQEAKENGKAIDLRQPIREYVAGVWSLHVSLQNEIDERLRDRFLLYRSIIAQYLQSGPPTPHAVYAVRLGEDGRRLEEIALVDHLIGYYDLLRDKNAKVPDLIRSYASNHCKQS
jgi:hypothetical protein